MSEVAGLGPEERERLVGRFGPEVLGWCAEPPATARGFAERWDLGIVAARGGGTSRVLRCLRREGGGPVWLKLTPDPDIAREEAEALRSRAATPAVVGLPAQDVSAGALLLESVEPGRPPAERGWSPPEVAGLLPELRAAAPAPRPGTRLRPLSHRVAFLFDRTRRRVAAAGLDGVLGGAALEAARAAALEPATSGPVGLVHGDLHPANVLSGAGARIVAIDPWPAWGDPDFDAVDWVLPGAADRAELERRIAHLSALVPGMSPDRLPAWCRALAVLLALPRLRARRTDPETVFLTALFRTRFPGTPDGARSR